MPSIKLALNGSPGNESPTLDEPALARVFERIRPQLERFARQRGLGNVAEDVVQETLLAALSGFREGRFRGQSTIETWIYGILRNKAGDQYRIQSREAKHLLAMTDDQGETDAFESNLLAVSAAPELVLLVEEVLQSLPARHWLILMLNQREGLKTREIAPLIKLSSGRTGAILAEAKEMFRRRMTGAEEIVYASRLIK